MPFVWAFAVWTVVVWGSRIRNILADDGSGASLVLAAVLTALGVLVAVAAATGWRRAQIVAVALVVTIGVWLVRPPLVLVHDHSVAFKVIHVGLAVVSVGLGVLALRGAAGQRVEPAGGPAATAGSL